MKHEVYKLGMHDGTRTNRPRMHYDVWSNECTKKHEVDGLGHLNETCYFMRTLNAWWTMSQGPKQQEIRVSPPFD